MTPTRDGPFLVDGPVEVVLDDGTTVRSDRFTVALCACRRSRTYPWCDTSHRRRVREPADRPSATHDERGERSERGERGDPAGPSEEAEE
ncbi:CDGSH iron-sulfur domain-containing protein [Streptomyces sp. NBC_01498]|uniref:CDGSH iron-sulfur domain-containing protein n=1 Tax=Streptomyces sp. NBC_01498 TaxID=2975870 RepID=UPI002E7ADF52|nr:CDGSH iron-sulfur domain-containing protein [Streptomyces sp. NBC_01498]WTL23400.1 CDGSH iron-sulfur domain-containing protein [Streptomyces sp. NBC_01498]